VAFYHVGRSFTKAKETLVVGVCSALCWFHQKPTRLNTRGGYVMHHFVSALQSSTTLTKTPISLTARLRTLLFDFLIRLFNEEKHV